MTKKVKLEDIKSMKGRTNWHYLKSSEKSSEASSIAPEIKQHQLNEMKPAAKKNPFNKQNQNRPQAGWTRSARLCF